MYWELLCYYVHWKNYPLTQTQGSPPVLIRTKRKIPPHAKREGRVIVPGESMPLLSVSPREQLLMAVDGNVKGLAPPATVIVAALSLCLLSSSCLLPLPPRFHPASSCSQRQFGLLRRWSRPSSSSSSSSHRRRCGRPTVGRCWVMLVILLSSPSWLLLLLLLVRPFPPMAAPHLHPASSCSQRRLAIVTSFHLPANSSHSPFPSRKCRGIGSSPCHLSSTLLAGTCSGSVGVGGVSSCVS